MQETNFGLKGLSTRFNSIFERFVVFDSEIRSPKFGQAVFQTCKYELNVFQQKQKASHWLVTRTKSKVTLTLYDQLHDAASFVLAIDHTAVLCSILILGILQLQRRRFRRVRHARLFVEIDNLLIFDVDDLAILLVPLQLVDGALLEVRYAGQRYAGVHFGIYLFDVT